ncbi:MAG: tetratricopeptide repeat protein [Candidatus Accumulibacter necessarius]|jgi:tetratricopeptide (TPR) repeat protein|uniref:tetratricopeptide repeat protein n=1 Tax=Candidatus Accumulibacter necessarius TaxID=2954386 RepID=UPI002FC3CB26
MSCAAFIAMADSLSDAQRLMKQGDPSRALEAIEVHVASKPDDAQGRFTKGLILAEMGRPAEAIAVFGKLVEDYPELPEPYNNLAVLYAQQKQYDKARTALEMAIRIHPAYATAFENLGDLHSRLASQAYEKALQLDPSRRMTQSKLTRLRDPAGPLSNRVGGQGEAMRLTGETSNTANAAAAAASAGAGVATAKPTEGVSPAARVGDEAGVTKTLQGWANAWSRKDAKAYFAYYAADFRPPGGVARKAWEEGRTRAMKKPGKLLVKVEDIKVSFADDKATVRLRQNYSSPYLDSLVTKTMVLVRAKGKWLIQQERVG